MRVKRRFEAGIRQRYSNNNDNKNLVDQVIIHSQQSVQKAQNQNDNAAGDHHHKLPPKDAVAVAFSNFEDFSQTLCVGFHVNVWKDKKYRGNGNGNQQRNEKHDLIQNRIITRIGHDHPIYKH